MSALKSVFICGECGYESRKWLGRCPSCQTWNSFQEETPAPVRATASGRTPSPRQQPVPLNQVPREQFARTSTRISELDRVLGGGIVGGSMVLIGGGMDFSVGAVMSAAAIFTSFTMDSRDGFWLFAQVLVLCLGMGALVGLLNGFFVVKIGLPAMIVTMAVSNIVSRLQYVLTAGSPAGWAGPRFINSVIHRFFDVIPSIVLYAAVFFPIVFWLLQRSRFGKRVYLVGNNRQAAYLSGVKVNRVIVLTYVFSGMMSAFAGILGAGYKATARVDIFSEYAFTSLVAVIIGGTTFQGGVGTYGGTIAGALLMTVLSNLLTTLGLPQTMRDILNGLIIILLLMMYNRSKAVRQ